MQADLFFVNAKVVNVYTGEIIEQNVATFGDRIAYVGPSENLSGPETEVIDARGSYLIPGFFDAHAHADLFYHPFSYVNHVLTQGTTGLFNDGHDLANAVGAETYLNSMKSLEKGAISVYTGIPAAAPPYPEVEGGNLWSDEDLEKALTYDHVVSLSEITPYLRVINGEPVLKRRIQMARQKGRRVEGHTTGANVEKLNILARAGITSCHESLKAQDAVDRLRLGYYVMLRHGSIRRDMPYLADFVKQFQGFDTSRIMLVPDGIFPDHLESWGNMDWVITQAVKEGIDPVRAIQMGTINPARYFGLDHDQGGIAPGRLAHLLVVDQIEKPTPRLVVARGKVAARNGTLTIPPFPAPEPTMGSRPFQLAPFNRETFQIKCRNSSKTVPVIRVLDQTVTTLENTPIQVENGFYKPHGDILSATLITRDGTMKGQGFVGGFCPGLGGLASTISHETHGLFVLGQNDGDMMLAAQKVLEMGGGLAIFQDGVLKAEIPLAVGGVCSVKPVPELAKEIIEFHGVLANYGCTLPYPLWTLGFLTFTSVLKVRITYSGVYDVKEEKIIF